MAIYHLTAKAHSRAKGHSAVAGAAYQSRGSILDERTGQRHDYSRKSSELLFEGIFAPKDAPDWTRDRAQLWNHVEAFEKRRDSQLARAFDIALPHELTPEQNRHALQDWVRENFTRKGLIADVAIHAPHRFGDERNIHAHVLVVTRKLDGTEFAAKKEHFKSFAERDAALEALRESWERIGNRHLERHGFEPTLDHRSYQDRGIDQLPTVHLGKKATALERDGVATERGDLNRDIQQFNAGWRQLLAVKAELTIHEAVREAAQRAETQRAFGLHATRTTEPRAEHFDRDVADTEWMEKLEAAAIKHEKASRQRPAHETGKEGHDRPAARGDYAPLQMPDAVPTAHAQQGLASTAGEIRLAWTLTRDGAQFAEEIENRGLILVHVSAEEARASERAHAFAHALDRRNPELREGFAVVDQRGNVTRIDQRVTGDFNEEIEKRLGRVDRSELLSVAQAREVMAEVRKSQFLNQQQEQREQARPVSSLEGRIIECADQARRYGAIIERDGEGRRTSEAEVLAIRLNESGERTIHECEKQERLYGGVVSRDESGERTATCATVFGPEAFAARLDEAGIALVRVTAADVIALDALRRQAELASMVAWAEAVTASVRDCRHFAELRPGEAAAVTRGGDVHRINPDKLSGVEIDDNLPSVVEARAAFETDRVRKDALWKAREADRSDEREAFAAKREERADDAHNERQKRETAHELGRAADEAKSVSRNLLGVLSKVLETGFNLIFGWAMAGPKLTKQQAHEKEQARGNLETLHAEAAAEAKEAREVEFDWTEHARKTAVQRKNLVTAERLSRPATSEALLNREYDDDRGRER